MTMRIRSLTLAAPLLAGVWASTAIAAETPRYTWLGVAYQKTDVNYVVKLNGAEHDGVKVDLSLGLAEFGRFGVHVFGEYFDGDFGGACLTAVDTSGVCPAAGRGDRDSKSWVGGAGLSYGLTDATHVVGSVAYLNAELEDADEDGYTAQLLLRSALSERVELEGGYRYSDVGGASDISNNDILIGLGYHLTDWLSLRGRGIVFDDDTGWEVGFRMYFGGFLGRDNLFR